MAGLASEPAPPNTIGLKQNVRAVARVTGQLDRRQAQHVRIVGEGGQYLSQPRFDFGILSVDAAHRPVVDVGVRNEDVVEVVEKTLVDRRGVVHEQLLDLQPV